MKGYETGMNYRHRILLTLKTSGAVGCTQRYLEKTCRMPKGALTRALDIMYTSRRGDVDRRNGIYYYCESPPMSEMVPRGYPCGCWNNRSSRSPY